MLGRRQDFSPTNQIFASSMNSQIGDISADVARRTTAFDNSYCSSCLRRGKMLCTSCSLSKPYRTVSGCNSSNGCCPPLCLRFNDSFQLPDLLPPFISPQHKGISVPRGQQFRLTAATRRYGKGKQQLGRLLERRALCEPRRDFFRSSWCYCGHKVKEDREAQNRVANRDQVVQDVCHCLLRDPDRAHTQMADFRAGACAPWNPQPDASLDGVDIHHGEQRANFFPAPLLRLPASHYAGLHHACRSGQRQARRPVSKPGILSGPSPARLRRVWRSGPLGKRFVETRCSHPTCGGMGRPRKALPAAMPCAPASDPWYPLRSFAARRRPSKQRRAGPWAGRALSLQRAVASSISKASLLPLAQGCGVGEHLSGDDVTGPTASRRTRTDGAPEGRQPACQRHLCSHRPHRGSRVVIGLGRILVSLVRHPARTIQHVPRCYLQPRSASSS